MKPLMQVWAGRLSLSVEVNKQVFVIEVFSNGQRPKHQAWKWSVGRDTYDAPTIAHGYESTFERAFTRARTTCRKAARSK